MTWGSRQSQLLHRQRERETATATATMEIGHLLRVGAGMVRS